MSSPGASLTRGDGGGLGMSRKGSSGFFLVRVAISLWHLFLLSLVSIITIIFATVIVIALTVHAPILNTTVIVTMLTRAPDLRLNRLQHHGPRI